MNRYWHSQKLRVRIAVALAPSLLALMAVTSASARQDIASAQTKNDASPQAAAPTKPAVFELADCIRMALERQPRIAVQRASLCAAEDGCRALEAMRLAALVDPEIGCRRRQAGLGVAAANAGVEQAERETTYAVTRTYFTVIYAREQERVARSVVERLTGVHDSAKKQVDAGAAGVTTIDLDRVRTYLQLAKTRQIQAAQGVHRAMAALREAMNLPCDVSFEIGSGRLFEVKIKLVREEVVALALARRPELVRAGLFADIVCLEVQVQGICIHPRKETFAAGADIHSFQVPNGVQNGDYKPGAVPPEMPTMLFGARPDRVRHAQSLLARAQATVEVTRNLISLEAEDAFLRLEESLSEIIEAKMAADIADQMAENLNKDFTSGAKVKVDDVVNARVLAAQARAAANEFLYKQILAVADIERITAGAISPVWNEAVAVPAAGPGKDQGK